MQELSGKLSEQEIEALKQKHKTVFELVVDDAVCYLRKPGRQDLSAASSLSNGDGLLFNEQILNDCWLAGDERIKNDDDYFLSASAKISGLLETKVAELKKI